MYFTQQIKETKSTLVQNYKIINTDVPHDRDDQACFVYLKLLLDGKKALIRKGLFDPKKIVIIVNGDYPERAAASLVKLFTDGNHQDNLRYCPTILVGASYQESGMGTPAATSTEEDVRDPLTGEAFSDEDFKKYQNFVEKDLIKVRTEILDNCKKTGSRIEAMFISKPPVAKKGDEEFWHPEAFIQDFGSQKTSLLSKVLFEGQYDPKNPETLTNSFNADKELTPTLVDHCKEFNIPLTFLFGDVAKVESMNSSVLSLLPTPYKAYMDGSIMTYLRCKMSQWSFKPKTANGTGLGDLCLQYFDRNQKNEDEKEATRQAMLAAITQDPRANGYFLRVPTLFADKFLTEGLGFKPKTEDDPKRDKFENALNKIMQETNPAMPEETFITLTEAQQKEIQKVRLTAEERELIKSGSCFNQFFEFKQPKDEGYKKEIDAIQKKVNGAQELFSRKIEELIKNSKLTPMIVLYDLFAGFEFFKDITPKQDKELDSVVIR